MPFKKGTPKQGGRQKGSVNKTTAQIRGVINDVCEEYFNGERFLADLSDMAPNDRARVYLKLLEFSAPRLTAQAIQLQTEDSNKPTEILITRKLITGRSNDS